jgi:hypothetical protein
MLRRLHRALGGSLWDLIIMWRAVRSSQPDFGDAPIEVVRRWSGENTLRFEGYPEIQDAIGYAQAELWVRERLAARPGRRQACDAMA